MIGNSLSRIFPEEGKISAAVLALWLFEKLKVPNLSRFMAQKHYNKPPDAYPHFLKTEKAAVTRAVRKLRNNETLTEFETECFNIWNLTCRKVPLDTELKNGR